LPGVWMALPLAVAQLPPSSLHSWLHRASLVEPTR
jgi:hypothetical protein